MNKKERKILQELLNIYYESINSDSNGTEEMLNIIEELQVRLNNTED